MENTGWIKLYRKITEWEWYDNHNTTRLFIHLLVTVNHEEGKWRGRVIQRGQRATSLRRLATECGLSIKSLRTSLNKLKSAHVVAHEGHSDFSLLTVLNYSEYQKKDTQTDTLGASEGQLYKNNKNNKEDKNKDISDSASQPPKIKKVKQVVNGEAYRGRDQTFDNFLNHCSNRGITPNIHIKKYFEIRDEFTTKAPFWEETKRCVDWLYDKGLKSINAQRLRNRMLNFIKFSKEKEIKQKQEYRDLKDQKMAKPLPAKLPPVWTPPL